jgi:hypothetical protein
VIVSAPFPRIRLTRPPTVRIYVGSRRIIIPFKFRGVTSRITSHILPT